MSEPRLLTFVTGNLNKLKEFQAIFGELSNTILRHEALDVPELQGSIEEVAKEKCKTAFKLLNQPVITEDTCLIFDAFGHDSLPGPYIKWFLKSLGPEGLFKMLQGFENKSAQAVCTFAYCDASCHEDPVLFQGVQKGSIVEPRGILDSGWDPIFVPENETQTYAEMSKDHKNSISHRFLAVEKLTNFLLTKQ